MDKKLPGDQYMWNALIFLLFPLAVVGAYMLIARMVGIQQLYAMSIFDILIMLFAIFRIIRLIVYDKIFNFARHWFMDAQPDGSLIKPAGGFRRAVAELMECMWCVGVWAALFVVTLYVIWPLARFAGLILALSALASFFQVISRHIGTHDPKCQ